MSRPLPRSPHEAIARLRARHAEAADAVNNRVELARIMEDYGIRTIGGKGEGAGGLLGLLPRGAGDCAGGGVHVRLLVCGSREWTDRERVYREIDALAPTSIIHGCAPGADTIAGDAPVRAGSTINAVLRFPADWRNDGRAAGPKRNALMLAEGKPDRGLAFGALWRLLVGPFCCSVCHRPIDDPRDHAGWCERTDVPNRWRHTGTGDMVSRLLNARLPVRWIVAPGAEAVDLVEMPGPAGGGER